MTPALPLQVKSAHAAQRFWQVHWSLSLCQDDTKWHDPTNLNRRVGEYTNGVAARQLSGGQSNKK